MIYKKPELVDTYTANVCECENKDKPIHLKDGSILLVPTETIDVVIKKYSKVE